MKIKEVFLKIYKNYKNLIWWRNLFVWRLLVPPLFKDNNGSYILKESWDNLIILDACRYDLFEKVFRERKIKGKLECRISRGAETRTFLLENFGIGTFSDTIYITANPFVDKLLRGKFYKIISLWDKGWSEKHCTVLPSTVYKYALATIQKYLDKKLIIHFIQPHYPYITAPQIDDGSLTELRNSILQHRKAEVRPPEDSLFQLSSMHFYTKIDADVHWQSYEENLNLVMSYVEKLIDFLPGQTVVTSDHGEAFGEKIHSLIPIRVYGHLPKIRIPALVEVPWLIIEPEEKEPKNIEKEISRIKVKHKQRAIMGKREELRARIRKIKAEIKR